MTAPSVRVLGALAVIDVDGRALDLGPARQRAVLAVLLLDADQPISGADLALRVWGGDPPPSADQAMRSYLCRLRKIVDTSSVVRLQRRDGGYVAAVGDDHLDLVRFRRLAGRARVAVREGRTAQALDGFAAALALASDDLLTGVTSDWLDERRRLLERERHAVALERNDVALATGSPALVAADAVARLCSDPYDERIAGQAMLGLAGVGRPADALAVFQQLRERLGEELGIDPGPGLQDIHQRVLRRSEPVVSRVTPVGPPAPARPVPRQLPPATRGFVDRETESAELDRLLIVQSAEPGEGSPTALLCGPGGAGKSALAAIWAHRHADSFPDGQLYVDLHGFDPGCRPITPETALRSLLTALGLDPAGIPADLASMVSAYRTLLADRRVLLVADDVASADQVRPLLPPGAGSATVITSRSGLPALVTTAGTQILPLGLLDDDAARLLLTRRLGANRTASEPVSVDRLLGHCGGLPLALAIVAGRAAAVPSLPLAALSDELDDDSRRLAALNPGESGIGLAAVVAASVASLSGPARSVLEWLAAGPRISICSGTVAALAALQPAEADAVVRELLGIHLLEPDGHRRFRLHDLVRLAVGSRRTVGLGVAVDRLVAFMITAAGTPRGAEPADLLAALAYAAERGLDAAVCDLAGALEAPLHSTGRWVELVAVTDRAVCAADRLGDDFRRTTALIGRGRGRIGLREFCRAESDLTVAMGAARTTGDLGLRARAHRALARLAAHQGRFDLALPHDQCGLALHLERGDLLGEAHAYNAIGWHQAHLGRAAEGLQSCRCGLVIFLEQVDPAGQALTQDSIGYALEQLGRLDEAADAYRRGAELCRGLGWQVVLANTLRRLANVCRRLGDNHGAAAASQEAADLLRLLGREILEP